MASRADIVTGSIEFTAEWEARLFAMIATLIAEDVFDWADFRAQLLTANHSSPETSGEPAATTDLAPWAYALRGLLHERGLLA